MDQDQKKVFAQYEEAKLEIRRLEVICKELQPTILSIVPEGKNVLGEKGYFYIQKRPKWKYTAMVTKAEEDLEKMMEDEKARGEAVVSYTPTLYYKEGSPEKREEA